MTLPILVLDPHRLCVYGGKGVETTISEHLHGEYNKAENFKQ